jgi:hypothetical protein
VAAAPRRRDREPADVLARFGLGGEEIDALVKSGGMRQ